MFEKTISKLANVERAQRVAALTVFAVHWDRIFVKGMAANGTKIGKYKAGAYKERRAELGRETSFVNLSFTEAMRKDYKPTTSGIVGFGFSNQRELDKAEWNETRYSKSIFALTQAEKDLYTKTFNEALFGK